MAKKKKKIKPVINCHTLLTRNILFGKLKVYFLQPFCKTDIFPYHSKKQTQKKELTREGI